MKLSLKIYLKPDADFQVDAEPSDTIGDLKEKIKESHGYDIDKQNILFSARNLANDRTLESCNISERGFLVLTVTEPEGPLPVPEPIGVEEYYDHPEIYDFDLSTLNIPPTKPYKSSLTGVAPDPDTTTPPSDPDTTTASGSASNYVPMSPSVFDPEFMSMTPIPPVTTASTFEYKPMSSSSSALPSNNVTPSVPHPPNTSASTFKYVPMPSSTFDPETMSTTPIPPVTTASTFKYRPLSSSPSVSSPASTSDTVSTFTYKPLTSSVSGSNPTSQSTFKYRPFSSSASASGSASTSDTASQSTFKYRPMTSSSSAPVTASTSTTALQHGSALGSGILGAGSGNSGNTTAGPNNAQLAQFRELITQNPQLRQQFLQRFAQNNPELGQLLTQNPDLLSQFLESMGGGGAIPDVQAARLNITDADREAIERLEAFGFPKQAIIEAYFACDKNEELAANYLAENASG